jgi:hypothetical protein
MAVKTNVVLIASHERVNMLHTYSMAASGKLRCNVVCLREWRLWAVHVGLQ